MFFLYTNAPFDSIIRYSIFIQNFSRLCHLRLGWDCWRVGSIQPIRLYGLCGVCATREPSGIIRAIGLFGSFPSLTVIVAESLTTGRYRKILALYGLLFLPTLRMSPSLPLPLPAHVHVHVRVPIHVHRCVTPI